MPDPEQEPASHQRSPVDVLHLVVAALAFLACLTLAVGAENTMVGIEADLLWLVDRLVRGMGGRVWVEDNQGGGACFVVELPDLAPV